MCRGMTEIEKLTHSSVSFVGINYVTLVANAVFNYVLELFLYGVFQLFKQRLVVDDTVLYDLRASVGENRIGKSGERIGIAKH